jgi:hypothetical protein
MPVTTTTRQERSPAVEAGIAGMQDTLGQLGQGMQSAYGAKEQTFEGLMSALFDMYRSRGSDAAQAIQASALSSGLTPLDASQEGNVALLDALQQYAPVQADLAAQQADVGINLQNALAGLQQSIGMPLLSNVLTPYEMAVSGRTETMDDPMRRYGMLADISTAMSGDELDRMKLAEQIRQFDLSFEEQAKQFGQQMAVQQSQFDQELSAINSRFDKGLYSTFMNNAMNIQASATENQKARDALRSQQDRQHKILMDEVKRALGGDDAEMVDSVQGGADALYDSPGVGAGVGGGGFGAGIGPSGVTTIGG